MNYVAKFLGYLVMAVLAALVIGLVLSWPVMLLWNLCLVPAVPGLNPIEWLQAFGIMVLFNMLFKVHVTQK